MAVVINGNGAVTGLTALPDSAMAEGSVIQVVSVLKNDSFSTTSSSFVDITGFTLDITPQSTSSKILIFSTFAWGNNVNTNASCEANLVRVLGGSATNLAQPANSGATVVLSNPNSNLIFTTGRGDFIFLDSPNTTNTVTYKWQTKSDGSATTFINTRSVDNNLDQSATITAMEITN